MSNLTNIIFLKFLKKNWINIFKSIIIKYTYKHCKVFWTSVFIVLKLLKKEKSSKKYLLRL